jgi:predicted metal-dependent phosphotriesterase family hydrolase
VSRPIVRTVLGDRAPEVAGLVYAHEHLIIDSPLIADRFPHIHLHDCDAAVAEVAACRTAGVALMVDAMPVCAGRDVIRLATVAARAGVDIVASTGLHHDRYYGPPHWTNRVGPDELAELFIADLTRGVDEFDYTSPVVRRTRHRAGVVKVATSGIVPDARDVRNLRAAAAASVATGAPVLTHCEDRLGGLAQLDVLAAEGVPLTSVIFSHVDKVHDYHYLRDLAETGAVLEFDQALRQAARGTAPMTVRAISALAMAGFADQIVVGTDGARRSLWASLGGSPGLAWLARELPGLLRRAGLGPDIVDAIMRDNAVRALTWRDGGERGFDPNLNRSERSDLS